MEQGTGGGKQVKLEAKQGGKKKPLFSFYKKTYEDGTSEEFGCVYGDTNESKILVGFLESFGGELLIGAIITALVTFIISILSKLLEMSLGDLCRIILIAGATYCFLKLIDKTEKVFGSENGKIKIIE